MDILSVIGIVLALVAIMGGQIVEGGHLGSLVNVPAILMGAIYGAKTNDVEMYHRIFDLPEIRKIEVKINRVDMPEVQRIRIEATGRSAMVDARNRGGGRLAIVDALPSREEAIAAAKKLGIVVAE